MKKLMMMVLILSSVTVQAECTLRHWIDPLFTKNFPKAVEKVLKKKGYKTLKFSDDFFEDYRLVLSYYSGDKNFVRYYFQVFEAPNFTTIDKEDFSVVEKSKEAQTLAVLSRIPNCQN